MSEGIVDAFKHPLHDVPTPSQLAPTSSFVMDLQSEELLYNALTDKAHSHVDDSHVLNLDGEYSPILIKMGNCIYYVMWFCIEIIITTLVVVVVVVVVVWIRDREVR